MKLNLKNSTLSVIVLASLVGCGSDGGGGLNGSGFNYNVNVNNGATNGLAGSVVTAQELANAIASNRFGQSSQPGLYQFKKAAAYENYDCEEKWYGTRCKSSYTGSGSQYIGYRGLRTDGSIERTINDNYTTYTFPEDVKYGANLSELASYLAGAVSNARNNGNLYKVDSYGVPYQYKDNMNCDQYSYNYGAYNQCMTIKNVSTFKWIVVIDGRANLIDLTQSLIKQPVARQYESSNVGHTAY